VCGGCLGHLISSIVAGHVIYDHVGAGLAESNRDCFSDAGVRAGYQSFLTIQ
jgi:hypothetical protein